jgi:hypothetical protein
MYDKYLGDQKVSKDSWIEMPFCTETKPDDGPFVRLIAHMDATSCTHNQDPHITRAVIDRLNDNSCCNKSEDDRKEYGCAEIGHVLEVID